MASRISRGIRFYQPPSPNQYFGLNPALTAYGNPGVYSSIIPSLPKNLRFGPNLALRVWFRLSHPRALLLATMMKFGGDSHNLRSKLSSWYPYLSCIACSRKSKCHLDFSGVFSLHRLVHGVIFLTPPKSIHTRYVNWMRPFLSSHLLNEEGILFRTLDEGRLVWVSTRFFFGFQKNEACMKKRF